MKELINIQSELKAPKSQFNSFGKYSYRSAEDILEAVKPLLKKYDCHLTVSDEMVQLGDRFYVKATATISKASGDGEVSVSAYAREEEVKKGMDASQITGSTSSYARKYALNGLLCIDDTKDSDSTNTHGKEEPPKPAPKAKAQAPAPDDLADDLSQAKKAVGLSKSSKDLMEVWKVFKNLQGVAEFKQMMTNRKKELGIK